MCLNLFVSINTLEAYLAEMKNLEMKILNLLVKALGMHQNDMRELFEEGMQSMRMNYYPPCPQPEHVTGLHSHSDSNGLTILLQINDIEVLQIRKDGNWAPINPLPNAFVINLGNTLEVIYHFIPQQLCNA
ncbi:2OG-FeII_Oxy domain-containing protein [Cephalotus follicularis]|uniref:2OG-FeII_Oxy domain-containing protein n=1 Tax=Cephalotus follicularis TaxID=3775 RepID=A0A1Q3CR66_CEPFO|nr:2OG-FeII_Oxy domain-containing protein [Cephalotus follicularis]